MKAIFFHRTGGPEVLELAECPQQPPREGEVQIRVTSAGLNRADALFRQGRHLLRPRLPSRSGMEAAGIVEAVGPRVTWRVGDRVAVLPASYDVSSQGGAAEFMTVPAALLVPTPSSVSDADAGAVWMQFLTAWGAFRHLMQVSAGQHVVITAASSSTGLAAIQVARDAGAIPIATTTSAAKIPRLLAAGAAHVIDIRTEHYLSRVREVTEGRGVDCVFDPVAGSLMADHIKACSPEAWIFVYGTLDPSPMPVHPGLLLAKNLNLRGYTLATLFKNRPALEQAVAAIAAGLEGGTFHLHIDRRFPLAETADAHRYMESNQQFGKIVVVI